MQEKSDEELWQGLQAGDDTDFSMLYQRYARALFNYGFKITSQAEMVQDVVQDLFIEIWKSKNSSQVNNVKFYLFRAFRYKIFRMLKKESNVLEETFENLYEPSIEDEWATLELENEQMVLLQNFIRQLPERQQEALTLKYFQSFSSEEIAKLMDINYQSVSNLLFKALSTLREKFTAVKSVK